MKFSIFKLISIFSFIFFTYFAKAEVKNSVYLMVVPKNPNNWAFMGGYISIVSENIFYQLVPRNFMIPINYGNKIDLKVFAMNVQPELHFSCSNLFVSNEKLNVLEFELKTDFKIHCLYY
ncbi:hypothetical protein QEJ31_01240 [Pigmentibacter sp. JX0631]|uniref:hypothetical protein n=1 Tax=Pigmentibacter sp. JX0631 TaxID=2976982 RepID=UPI002468EB7A|nr:hypothetical protein [Pigmentibacter sp. JX0631]WGL60228.1 hypothetical protein QEJ31_01240 [Pigmentibacter sp. JX0631]